MREEVKGRELSQGEEKNEMPKIRLFYQCVLRNESLSASCQFALVVQYAVPIIMYVMVINEVCHIPRLQGKYNQ